MEGMEEGQIKITYNSGQIYMHKLLWYKSHIRTCLKILNVFTLFRLIGGFQLTTCR